MVFSMRLRTIVIVAVTALLLTGLYLAAAHFGAPALANGPQDRYPTVSISERKRLT